MLKSVPWPLCILEQRFAILEETAKPSPSKRFSSKVLDSVSWNLVAQCFEDAPLFLMSGKKPSIRTGQKKTVSLFVCVRALAFHGFP